MEKIHRATDLFGCVPVRMSHFVPPPFLLLPISAVISCFLSCPPKLTFLFLCLFILPPLWTNNCHFSVRQHHMLSPAVRGAISPSTFSFKPHPPLRQTKKLLQCREKHKKPHIICQRAVVSFSLKPQTSVLSWSVFIPLYTVPEAYSIAVIINRKSNPYGLTVNQLMNIQQHL